MFKAYLCLGEIEVIIFLFKKATLLTTNLLLQKAYESIKLAIELDPTDSSNKQDKEKCEEVMNYQRVVNRAIENNESETVVKYCDNVLAECPASLNHINLKLEHLLKSHNIKEAVSYSAELTKNRHLMQSSKILGWRGRILIYNGQEKEGIQILRQALDKDPDNVEFQKAIKRAKTSTERKEEATQLFKSSHY